MVRLLPEPYVCHTIQLVDFFGTGPRIPMIAVSPFSTGGHIKHTYTEHFSFVKFVEDSSNP
jgi:phospholipase C